MNLADFPISVLRRQAPRDAEGRMIDQMVYEASTYDPIGRRRVPQRVTLTTSSRYGLPTPADESVVLALLYTAKRAHDLAEPRVHFTPHQLFQVMRWDANSRSYARLSQVLLRLKSLTILYENAWWDASGRRYEEELATGIVAEYRLVKSKVRRKKNELPESYVHWTPRFFQSLASGNLKKLDLGLFFSLSLPTSQRMYRFLDKRFYNAPVVEMDLREFVCGHLGVTSSPNVAELKRRIAPAVAELEAAGFIEPAGPEDRYVKFDKGIWRVRFRRGPGPRADQTPPAVVTPRPSPSAAPEAPASRPPGDTPLQEARSLVRAFYQEWTPGARAEPTDNELAKAADLVRRYGADAALALVPRAVALLRERFPAARWFGASLPYFEEAARTGRARRVDEAEARRRQAAREDTERLRADEEAFFERWTPPWDALADAEREAIRSAVLAKHPYLTRPLLLTSRIALRFFLEELAKRSGDLA